MNQIPAIPPPIEDVAPETLPILPPPETFLPPLDEIDIPPPPSPDALPPLDPSLLNLLPPPEDDDFIANDEEEPINQDSQDAVPTFASEHNTETQSEEKSSEGTESKEKKKHRTDKKATIRKKREGSKDDLKGGDSTGKVESKEKPKKDKNGKPKKRKAKEWVISIYGYAATGQKNSRGEQDLSFAKGQLLPVIERRPNWLLCRLAGVEGVVPGNYVVSVPRDQWPVKKKKPKEEPKEETEVERKMREAQERMKAAELELQAKREAEEKAKKEEKKKGTLRGIFGKKRPTSEIGTVYNVKHEGHVGFDKKEGSFQTRNLPSQYQLIFDRLNHTLDQMGVSGITEKEAKLLLRALPTLMRDATESSSSSPQQTPKVPKTKREEELEERLKEEEAVVKDLREQLKRQGEELRKMEMDVLRLTAQVHPNSSSSGSSEALDAAVQQIRDKADQAVKELEKKLKKEAAKVAKERKERHRLEQKLETLSKELAHSSPSSSVPPLAETVVEKEKVVETSPSAPLPPPPPPPGESPTPQPKVQKAEKKEEKKEEKKVPEKRGNFDLLEAIKQPRALRHVSEEEKVPAKPLEDDQNVLNLIAKALIDRRNAVKDDDEEANDDDDNLEDWM